MRETSFEIFIAMSLILLDGEFIRLFICVMFSGKSGSPSMSSTNSFVAEKTLPTFFSGRGIIIRLMVSPFSQRIW